MISRSTPLTSRFIDPRILAASSNLQLIARTVVEGFVAGLHRSPYHGFSLEFSEYREYTPGDDIRQVDWKIFGRSDRFYVKKFQGDTNTQIFLLLDTSRSMTFSSHEVPKIDYARYLTAALAYLAVRQGDAVGLLSFDSQIRRFTPPRTRHGHLLTLLHHLETIEPRSETQISEVLEELSRMIRKRSLVVIISDFYADTESLAKSLRFFHHRGNDVLLFHVLDPAELEMPMEGISTLKDMETGDQISFSAEHSRAAYLEEIGAHIRNLKRECRNVRIEYELMDSSKPLDQALYRYLSARARRI